MTDILQSLSDFVATIDDDEADSDTFDISEIYIIMSRAVGEITRLRKANIDLNWKINPDRSGGCFTDEEIESGKWGSNGW
jgi:hypothetical protein